MGSERLTLETSFLAKIMGREALAERLRAERADGRRVVFTNGCFDLLHAGHVRYLAQARALGDLLVVGLNSDASVRGLKGPARPIRPQERRAEVLAALASVDYVTIFDEATPLELVLLLQPDVLVKGGDWPVERMVGAREVLARGGRAISLNLIQGESTTAIIARIVDLHGAASPPAR